MLSEISFCNMPVLLKNCGFDFMIVDTEHGGFDYKDISALLMTARLCGLDTIVRIADNSRRDIIRFLDMGAGGLLLPMTDTAAQIEKAVEYAKYAPLGRRGISTMRAHTLYSPGEILQYTEQANAHTKVFAQIETVSGLNNVAEILSVRGVFGALVGPNDLSCDFGTLGHECCAGIIDAIGRVASVAVNCGKTSGIITSNQRYIQAAKESEMQYFSVGSELSMLKSASDNIIKRIEE